MNKHFVLPFLDKGMRCATVLEQNDWVLWTARTGMFALRGSLTFEGPVVSCPPSVDERGAHGPCPGTEEKAGGADEHRWFKNCPLMFGYVRVYSHKCGF